MGNTLRLTEPVFCQLANWLVHARAIGWKIPYMQRFQSGANAASEPLGPDGSQKPSEQLMYDGLDQIHRSLWTNGDVSLLQMSVDAAMQFSPLRFPSASSFLIQLTLYLPGWPGVTVALQVDAVPGSCSAGPHLSNEAREQLLADCAFEPVLRSAAKR